MDGRHHPSLLKRARNLSRQNMYGIFGRHSQRIGLTDIILCEVLQGVRDDAVATAVERQLLRFEVFNTGGGALAAAAAQDYWTLRARGQTVRKTIDCLIATFCIRENHSLLHRDRDFDGFETVLGLSVFHP